MKYLKCIFALFLVSFLAAHATPTGWKDNSFNVGSINLVFQKNVAISADDQLVDPIDNAVVLITSDSTVAADRSFVVGEGIAMGAKLVVMCFVTGSNKAEILDDASIPSFGNMKLQGDWACTQKWDNLEIQWTGNHWVERGRVDQ